tara:strand:+ start:371 stop:556 length:186 start_codon:yes stop_codon:yes gene_type:complete
MIWDHQIGYALRLIFVYQGNIKKSKAALKENRDNERELNSQWGIYFIIISAIVFVLLYNLL